MERSPREYENDEAEMMCDASENLTTYVEAQSDKEFAIVFRVAPSFDWGKADIPDCKTNH